MKNYKRITVSNDSFCTNCDGICFCKTSCKIQDILQRLIELENKIESGELVDRDEYLDRLMAARDISGMTDKELEFFAKHNARVRENADAEIARLTAENAKIDEYKCVIDDISEQCRELETEVAELRARRDKAIELSVKVGDTVYCIRNCGTGRYRIEAHTVIEIVFEYDNQMRIKTNYGLFGYEKWTFGLDCFADPAEAEARLKKLQGGER